jgi:hypothetical protein
MWKRTIILFLTVTAGVASAGTDGYLTHTLPLTLRFDELPPMPPLVNELILAMDRPPVTTSSESGEHSDGAKDFDAEPANSALIHDLITGNALQVAAEKPSSVSVGPNNSGITFPDIPVPTPNQPETEAQMMQDVIMMFNPKKSGDRRDNGPIVGIPVSAMSPAFTPPQPFSPPSSKATYTVE